MIAAVELPTLEQFLIHWYGFAPQPVQPPPGDLSSLPAALANWYRITSRWPQLATSAQNHLATPAEVTIEDDKYLFWLENQGAWEWAYDPGVADPMVYDRETDSGRPWHPTGIPLSAFLVEIAMFERIMHTPLGARASGLTAAQLAAALAPTHLLELPAWQWPPPSMQFHLGFDLLAMASGHDELAGGYNVFIAGRSAAAGAYLAGTGIRWDWHNWTT